MGLNRGKFLEPDEVNSLRARLSYGVRDHVMVLFALETGARETEVLNLKQSDLYHDTNTVFIKTLKRGKDREIPVRPELMAALRRFVPFNIKARRLRDIWYSLRPVDKKFHALRHTFAVNLYHRTKDLKLVQLALGHTAMTSTVVYQDFVYSREQMSRILDVSISFNTIV